MFKLICMLSCMVCPVWAACPQDTVEIPEEPVPDFPQPDYVRIVQQSLDYELTWLRKLMKLEPGQVADIRLRLKPLIAAEIQRHKKNRTEPMVLGRLKLSQTLLDGIAKAADELAGDKNVSMQYRKDIQARTNFERNATTLSLVHRLDGLVGLTTKQMPAVNKLAIELYETGHIGTSPLTPRQSFRLDPMQWKRVLTQKQLAYYEEFSQLVGGTMTSGQREESRAQREERLVKQLRSVAAMRTNWLNNEFKLTPKQKKLQLVSKGVISSAASEKLDAEDKWRSERQTPRPRGQRDMKTFSLATADPVSLFAMQKKWLKFVRNTLVKEQRQLFDKHAAARQRRIPEILSYSLVSSLGRQFELNGKQQQATQKLFASQFVDVKTFDRPSPDTKLLRTIMAIPEKQYVAAMGEDNWGKFQQFLELIKLQLGEMEEKKEPDGTRSPATREAKLS